MSNEPLDVRVTDDLLLIEIGVDVCAFAFEQSDLNNPYDEEARGFRPKYKVVDPKQFAKEVKGAMLDEGEDGSSPLTRFLDKMFCAALDDGAVGVESIAEGDRG